jgi:hypothetical protein
MLISCRLLSSLYTAFDKGTGADLEQASRALIHVVAQRHSNRLGQRVRQPH